MGNRVAKLESPSEFVTIDHVDPPYRPIVDPATGQPLHVCGYKDLLVDHSCAAGELWWESELEPDLNLRPRYAACKTRDMKDGVACDMNAGFPNVQSCQYHTCSTVLPEVDCKKFVIKKLIGSNDPNQYAKATLTVNPKAYDGRKYSCTYKTSEIGSSCEVATEFTQDAKEALGLLPYDEWYDNATMNVLCSKRAPPSACPARPDGSEWPKDENGDPICSQLLACPLCNSWAMSTHPSASTEADNIMKEWCREHPTDPSCSCVRCMDDPLYRKIQEGLINMPLPGCWWKGCMDKNMTYNLVPAKDRSAEYCPPVFCANIINVLGGDIDIGTLNMSVSCEAGGDECTLDCGSHGRCTLDTENVPSCVCDVGWEGSRCEIQTTPPDDGAKLKKAAVVAAVSGVALVGVFLIASAFRKSKK